MGWFQLGFTLKVGQVRYIFEVQACEIVVLDGLSIFTVHVLCILELDVLSRKLFGAQCFLPDLLSGLEISFRYQTGIHKALLLYSLVFRCFNKGSWRWCWYKIWTFEGMAWIGPLDLLRNVQYDIWVTLQWVGLLKGLCGWILKSVLVLRKVRLWNLWFCGLYGSNKEQRLVHLLLGKICLAQQSISTSSAYVPTVSFSNFLSQLPNLWLWTLGDLHIGWRQINQGPWLPVCNRFIRHWLILL
jgi:hypothetical protein